MRILFGVGLLAVSTALSGCDSPTLDALSNLTNGCVTTTTSVNCTPNTVTPTSTGSTTTTTTTTPTGPTNTNGGNTSTIAAGDTTLALESNAAISTQSNPATSSLSSDPFAGSLVGTSFTINTHTASNGSWPITKTMDYYPAGGTTSNLADNPNYREYRYYKKGVYDEDLQVWNWNNSYATQYRDVTNSSTAPLHQAWSFGGKYTSVANMPTGGTANYNGSWAATAQTSGFVDTQSAAQTISYNNNWRVKGTSALSANFGTGVFTGTLTSTSWTAVTKDGTRFQDALDATDPQYSALNVVPQFMQTPVLLNGTISTSTAAGAHPNQIVGDANMQNTTYGWITTTGSNPMYGGFFGTGGATEVAGVFALDTAIPAPIGGNKPINDDRRGFLSMSGMFHGQ